MWVMLEILKREFRYFDLIAHGERHLRAVLRRRKIRLHSIPLQPGIKGYYTREKNGKCHIYVDSRLPHLEWLYVAFHELAHHFLHAPAHPRGAMYSSLLHADTKAEKEARAFAAILLIPTHDLEQIERDGWDELDCSEWDEFGNQIPLHPCLVEIVGERRKFQKTHAHLLVRDDLPKRRNQNAEK